MSHGVGIVHTVYGVLSDMVHLFFGTDFSFRANPAQLLVGVVFLVVILWSSCWREATLSTFLISGKTLILRKFASSRVTFVTKR